MKYTRQNGFTIVEVLTIVVVIGILAGIATFSVGMWRKQVAETEVTNDLKALSAAMENARNFENAYPTSLPSSFKPSENVTVTLETATETAYCAEGVSKVDASVQFTVQNGGSDPAPGSC